VNPTETYELREKIRAVLEKHGLLDNAPLEFDLMSAFNQYVRKPDSQPNTVNRQESTLQALAAGMGKNAQYEADWTRLFNTSPNWKTKTNSELMVWMKERGDNGESLDRFAEWWYANDWRGKRGEPPMSPGVVREMWMQAFGSNQRQRSDTRGYPTPEGL